MRHSLSFSFFGRTVDTFFRVSKSKTELQYGVGNRCKGGLYCLFLDYDAPVPKEWVYEEVGLLQASYPSVIGTAYLFQTKHGWHVVFLEKMPLRFIMDCLEITSADADFKKVPITAGRREWVLRASDKRNEQIEYLGCVRNPFGAPSVPRSNAHKLYLAQFRGVPEKDFLGGGVFDKEQTITFGWYRVARKNA